MAPGGRRRADAEPEPLGSLSQNDAPPPGTAVCELCEGTSLTRVPMTLGDGTAVTFISCHDCEARAWVRVEDGTRIDVESVLGRSART